ncbi:MAG TPA: ABC transporter substrate-binding protein [Thermomicrobiaceae bacterium]|nr:ABC transporter substrate-binding protein [Thermomicrobiaceae bacterium]
MRIQRSRDGYEIADQVDCTAEAGDAPPPAGSLNRRAFLRRVAAFGAAAPVVAGLLAACGSSASTSSSAASSSASSTAASTTSGASSSSSAGSVASSAATPASQSAGASPASSGSPAAGSLANFRIEPAKHTGGQFIWGETVDAKEVNPVVATDYESGEVMRMIYDGVMQVDVKTTTPAGLLAKSWEVSPDGLSYTFTLHDGIKFHDGTPLTANDVKFTYDLILNPATQSTSRGELAERVASISVADDLHVTFHMKKIAAPFLVANMTTGIVPQHILKDVPPAKIAADPFSTGQKGRTIGTGPFMFDEWIKDDHITLVKNPSYWRGTPNLDKWIYKVVPNASVLVQQLKTGELDYGSIQPSDYDDMRQQSNVVVHAYDTFNFTYYMYQLDPAKTTLFQDQAVRQALLYAIDRAAIVKSIYFGLAEVAVGTMPVISWAYNPNGITLKYPYDVDKANALLDAAGWKKGSDGIRAKNGQRLSFTLWSVSGSATTTATVAVFQQEWKKIGVAMQSQEEEWNAFLTRIENTHDFDIAFLGFAWSVDPDQTTMWACGSYTAGYDMNKYCNPQVDKLLADGIGTTDQAKRKQIYTQMQNILMTDLPNVVLLFSKAVVGVSKRTHNFFPNAVNAEFNGYQWWVDA